MDVFKWKENAKTVLISRRSIEEGNKKLYSLLPDKCETSLKTKLKGTKGYDKVHNTKDGINPMELISRVICDMEEHLQGTWATMKAKNVLTRSSEDKYDKL